MDPALEAEALALSRQEALKEALQRNDSDVSAFFKGAVVFMTGGSGFLGKQLIEKLFRCTDVKKVYVLLRGKKGKNTEERLKEIFQNPVYDCLHKEKPGFQKKVQAVEGDVSQLRIGLSEGDWEVLCNEVHVIFHVAATVNFEEPIKNATLINVRGAKEVLTLAKACKKLRSIVHVSTAFSHATSSRVKKQVVEQFYDSPIQPEELMRLVDTDDEGRLHDVWAQVRADWPNTYSFTKAVGEEVVRQMAGDLPVCIVRPAIVISAFREPSPGWMDEHIIYGASGLVFGVSMGVIHTMLADPENRINMVPVDIVNNALMAAAYATARRPKDIKIYTISNNRNPGTWDDLITTLDKEIRRIISPRTLWYCGGVHTKYKCLYILLTWLLHYIPACIADTTLFVLGKKTQFLKLYRKVSALSSVLCYFLIHHWVFSDENTQELYTSLSPTDQAVYNFDMGSVGYKDLIIVWYLGIRKYIIKDGLKNTKYGVMKQRWLKVINYIVFPIYLYCLYKLFCLFLSVFIVINQSLLTKV